MKKISLYLHDLGVSNYEIHPDNSVSVYQSVQIKTPLKELPIEFRHVEGDMNVFALGLKTAKGLPQTISGSLAINNNSLSSFDYFPNLIKKHLHLSFNSFTSLKDLKTEVQGTLYCDNNPLETLDITTSIGSKVYFYDEKNIHRRLKGLENFYDNNGFIIMDFDGLKSTILNNRLQDSLAQQPNQKKKKI